MWTGAYLRLQHAPPKQKKNMCMGIHGDSKDLSSRFPICARARRMNFGAQYSRKNSWSGAHLTNRRVDLGTFWATTKNKQRARGASSLHWHLCNGRRPATGLRHCVGSHYPPLPPNILVICTLCKLPATNETGNADLPAAVPCQHRTKLIKHGGHDAFDRLERQQGRLAARGLCMPSERLC